MADIWDSDERGKSQILRGALPLLGPAIGPMIGGVMVSSLHGQGVQGGSRME
jgi:MFS family permease